MLGVGCVGPHATGALWAQQDLQQEAALFKLSDAQRADRLMQFELGLADETLASERSRLGSELQDCPGTDREPLNVSTGDKPRDGVRVRALGNTERLALVSQLALADWQLRRGRSSGDAHFCELARATLAAPAQVSSGDEDGGDDLMLRLGTATVSRDGNAPAPSPAIPVDENDPLSALSLYAMGAIDTVTAPAPLPQYLAAVYGGQLISPPSRRGTGLGDNSIEALVDALVSRDADWEPDALYAAMRSQQ
jgi:hypothetical protein